MMIWRGFGATALAGLMDRDAQGPIRSRDVRTDRMRPLIKDPPDSPSPRAARRSSATENRGPAE